MYIYVENREAFRELITTTSIDALSLVMMKSRETPQSYVIRS